MIVGNTVLQKKKCLANLVAVHLKSVGHEASIIENRVNSEGHTDRVLVDSSIGLVHVVASVNEDPNGSIPTSDFEDGSQSFMTDKKYVAYGWNTKDRRTIVMVVPTSFVLGHKSLTKNEIKAERIKEFSFVLRQ